MEKNHGEREKFHYNNGDYNRILWCARVFGFESPTLEGILFIQVISLFIRPQSSALFEHLTAYLRGVRAEHPSLNWLSESPSLSGSLSLVVDAADPSPNCNCQIQIEIWLRCKNSHNWFYLLILSTRTAWSLNRLRTSAWRFWKRPRVARLFGTGKTHGVISMRSETDHYRYPLWSLLFGGGREPPRGQ